MWAILFLLFKIFSASTVVKRIILMWARAPPKCVQLRCWRAFSQGGINVSEAQWICQIHIAIYTKRAMEQKAQSKSWYGKKREEIDKKSICEFMRLCDVNVEEYTMIDDRLSATCSSSFFGVLAVFHVCIHVNWLDGTNWTSWPHLFLCRRPSQIYSSNFC